MKGSVSAFSNLEEKENNKFFGLPVVHVAANLHICNLHCFYINLVIFACPTSKKKNLVLVTCKLSEITWQHMVIWKDYLFGVILINF